MNKHKGIFLPLLIFISVGCSGSGQSNHASPVQAKLIPASSTVSSGSDFWVTLELTKSDITYNTWETLITYDPNAVTYLGTTQGCLMNGSCPDEEGVSACGSIFNQVFLTDDPSFPIGVLPVDLPPGFKGVYALDSMICYQTFLTGPGELYKFHFQATGSSEDTPIGFERFSVTNGVTASRDGTGTGAIIHIN